MHALCSLAALRAWYLHFMSCCDIPIVDRVARTPRDGTQNTTDRHERRSVLIGVGHCMPCMHCIHCQPPTLSVTLARAGDERRRTGPRRAPGGQEYRLVVTGQARCSMLDAATVKRCPGRRPTSWRDPKRVAAAHSSFGAGPKSARKYLVQPNGGKSIYPGRATGFSNRQLSAV
jgi:hypothetical protein